MLNTSHPNIQIFSKYLLSCKFPFWAKPIDIRGVAEPVLLISKSDLKCSFRYIILTPSFCLRRKLTVNRSRGWQRRTSQGEVIDLSSKDQYWRLYDKVWSLLIAMNGRGMSSKGNFHLTSPAGPISLGQRARGLVESINIPASEMAAVVSGGLGAVGIGSGGKLIDKSFRMRGEKCPRVVFRLVLLYLFEGDLESASRCVQQFLALLPGFLSTENEQNKNRLQLLLWYVWTCIAYISFDMSCTYRYLYSA